MEREEFTFTANKLHKDSEYHYNMNMAKKYSNLITLMRVEVENGNFELVVPSRDLTVEVIGWLHDNLGFNFCGIPRAQTVESNNWKLINSLPSLDNYEWIKIRW